MGIVYCATNVINGKKYIGKTVSSMEKRRWEHEWHSETRRDTSPLFHRALRAHGCSNFFWEMLFESKSRAVLIRMEIAFIAEMKTKFPDGYNLTDGGEGWSGAVFTEEHKANLSKAQKGRKTSQETKDKISAANIGKKWTQEQKARFSQQCVGRKGVSPSQETRRKLSAATKGKKKPLGHGANVSKGRKGIKFSEMHKKHIQDASKKRWQQEGYVNPCLGVPFTEEHKQKLVEAWKRRKLKKQGAGVMQWVRLLLFLSQVAHILQTLL